MCPALTRPSMDQAHTCAGEAVRQRAVLGGLPPFALLTVARDSCIFTWSYTKGPAAADPAAAAQVCHHVAAAEEQPGLGTADLSDRVVESCDRSRL